MPSRIRERQSFIISKKKLSNYGYKPSRDGKTPESCFTYGIPTQSSMFKHILVTIAIIS